MSLYFKRLIYRIKANFKTKNETKNNNTSFDENDKLLFYIEKNLMDGEKIEFNISYLRCNELNIELWFKDCNKKEIYYVEDEITDGKKINCLNRNQFEKLKNLINLRKLKIEEDIKNKVKQNIENFTQHIQ